MMAITVIKSNVAIIIGIGHHKLQSMGVVITLLHSSTFTIARGLGFRNETDRYAIIGNGRGLVAKFIIELAAVNIYLLVGIAI